MGDTLQGCCLAQTIPSKVSDTQHDAARFGSFPDSFCLAFAHFFSCSFPISPTWTGTRFFCSIYVGIILLALHICKGSQSRDFLKTKKSFWAFEEIWNCKFMGTFKVEQNAFWHEPMPARGRMYGCHNYSDFIYVASLLCPDNSFLFCSCWPVRSP